MQCYVLACYERARHEYIGPSLIRPVAGKGAMLCERHWRQVIAQDEEG